MLHFALADRAHLIECLHDPIGRLGAGADLGRLRYIEQHGRQLGIDIGQRYATLQIGSVFPIG